MLLVSIDLISDHLTLWIKLLAVSTLLELIMLLHANRNKGYVGVFETCLDSVDSIRALIDIIKGYIFLCKMPEIYSNIFYM